MLTLMDDLPDNVLGVSASGKITGADYEKVMIPAVEKKLKTNKKIRLLYHLGKQFTGFDLPAMMDDAKLGMKHFFAWDRVAFVSDHEVINIVAKFFGYMMPCEVRVFNNSNLEEAKKWLAEK